MRFGVVIGAGNQAALRAQEGLDLAYAALSLDWSVHVVLCAAGIEWLSLPSPDKTRRPGARALASLIDFDVAGIYAVAEPDVVLPAYVQRLSAHEASAFFQSMDRVIYT